jgi:hypothetical protein
MINTLKVTGNRIRDRLTGGFGLVKRLKVKVLLNKKLKGLEKTAVLSTYWYRLFIKVNNLPFSSCSWRVEWGVTHPGPVQQHTTPPR